MQVSGHAHLYYFGGERGVRGVSGVRGGKRVREDGIGEWQAGKGEETEGGDP